MKLLCYILPAIMLLFALSVSAQQRPLEGRVSAVGAQQATLSVYITVATPDAPGKVPDKFAAQAARLEDKAQQLDKQGKTALALQVRAKVRQLRCQREVELVVSGLDKLTILGVNSAALSTIPTGVHLSMEVSAPASSLTLPNRVTLVRTARQVNMRTPTVLHPLPHGANDPLSYFQLSGVVLSTNPIMIGINGRAFILDDPQGLGYRRQTPLQVSEFRVSQPVLVWASVGANAQVQQPKKVVVFTGAAEIPYDQIGDLNP